MRITAGLLLSGLLLYPGTGQAVYGAGEYPVIEAMVTPEKATVGTPLRYVVTISGKDLEGIDIVLPGEKEYFPDTAGRGEKAPGDAGKVPLYIIHSAKKKIGGGKDTPGISVILELSYYRPGKYPLPEVEIYDRDRVRIGYRIPETVISAVNEKGEFQEIEPPLVLRGNYYRLLLLSGALATTAAAAWFILGRVQKRRSGVTAVPETPAIDIFMEEINSLRSRNLIEEGKAGGFALELSRIFREFLSAHYRTDAMEMTSLDMQAFLGRSLPGPVYKNMESDLRRVLGLWDLAKFAGFSPDSGTLRSNLDSTVLMGRIIAREGLRVRD